MQKDENENKALDLTQLLSDIDKYQSRVESRSNQGKSTKKDKSEPKTNNKLPVIKTIAEFIPNRPPDKPLLKHEKIINRSVQIFSKNTNEKPARKLKPIKVIDIDIDRPSVPLFDRKKLEKELWHYLFHKHEITLQQFSYRRTKMDYAGISNNMLTEYELKCTHSDYWEDFTKVVSNGSFLANKHKMIQNGTFISNYFYFICAPGIIKLEELPEYCGLIYLSYTENPICITEAEVIKEAPLLHKNYLKEAFYKSLCSELLRNVYNLTNANDHLVLKCQEKK